MSGLFATVSLVAVLNVHWLLVGFPAPEYVERDRTPDLSVTPDPLSCRPRCPRRRAEFISHIR
ncbi:MAG: hypothetical protein IT334_08795 [Thermomicrobiales bacterium]|nr:hypothetical protein [Thermomicrobiales bacterium]